jgi:hypothetical protein
MKKHMVVKKECLSRILDCFSSREEFDDFLHMFYTLVREVTFANECARRDIENEEYAKIIMLKQLFVLGLFCKSNIEILRELIQAIEYDELTNEQIEALKEENPNSEII